MIVRAPLISRGILVPPVGRWLSWESAALAGRFRRLRRRTDDRIGNLQPPLQPRSTASPGFELRSHRSPGSLPVAVPWHRRHGDAARTTASRHGSPARPVRARGSQPRPARTRPRTWPVGAPRSPIPGGWQSAGQKSATGWRAPMPRHTQSGYATRSGSVLWS